jgi:hypothetical protein
MTECMICAAWCVLSEHGEMEKCLFYNPTDALCYTLKYIHFNI